MKISIVVCTHNRRQWLLECIESYYRMNSVDSIENELLVIDNHSKDDTAQCIENLNTKFKNRIKYFFVAELGVSRARNAGIENASGDYIAFVDDDCLFEAHWLENMVVGLNSYPHIRAFGGKIVTQFEQPTPEWLTPSRLRHFRYGATNFGNFERDLVAPEYPPGSNMVFRKDLLSPDFRFSTELGRKGNSLLSNEEKEIFARLQNQGEKNNVFA